MEHYITELQKYIWYDQEYTKKYGPLTCIMFKNGNFYELYEIPKPTSMLSNVSKLSIISELTNLIIITKSKRHEPSISNHFLCGFLVTSLNKYVKILTDNNFTCVVVDYINYNPINRKVTSIYYPFVHELE